MNRCIIENLRESRESHISRYKGFDITQDVEGYYHVANSSGKDFVSWSDAEDFIDTLTNREKISMKPPKKNKEKLYVIYIQGTYNPRTGEAIFLKRNSNTPKFMNLRVADKFPEYRMKAIIKNSSKYEYFEV